MCTWESHLLENSTLLIGKDNDYFFLKHKYVQINTVYALSHINRASTGACLYFSIIKVDVVTLLIHYRERSLTY